MWILFAQANTFTQFFAQNLQWKRQFNGRACVCPAVRQLTWHRTRTHSCAAVNLRFALQILRAEKPIWTYHMSTWQVPVNIACFVMPLISKFKSNILKMISKRKVWTMHLVESEPSTWINAYLFVSSGTKDILEK